MQRPKAEQLLVRRLIEGNQGLVKGFRDLTFKTIEGNPSNKSPNPFENPPLTRLLNVLTNQTQENQWRFLLGGIYGSQYAVSLGIPHTNLVVERTSVGGDHMVFILHDPQANELYVEVPKPPVAVEEARQIAKQVELRRSFSPDRRVELSPLEKLSPGGRQPSVAHGLEGVILAIQAAELRLADVTRGRRSNLEARLKDIEYPELIFIHEGSGDRDYLLKQPRYQAIGEFVIPLTVVPTIMTAVVIDEKARNIPVEPLFRGYWYSLQNVIKLVHGRPGNLEEVFRHTMIVQARSEKGPEVIKPDNRSQVVLVVLREGDDIWGQYRPANLGRLAWDPGDNSPLLYSPEVAQDLILAPYDISAEQSSMTGQNGRRAKPESYRPNVEFLDDRTIINLDKPLD